MLDQALRTAQSKYQTDIRSSPSNDGNHLPVFAESIDPVVVYTYGGGNALFGGAAGGTVLGYKCSHYRMNYPNRRRDVS